MDKKIKKAVKKILTDKKLKAKVKKVLAKEFGIKHYNDLITAKPDKLMEYLIKKYDIEKQDTNSRKFIIWVLNKIDERNLKMFLDLDGEKPTEDAKWFVLAVAKERNDLLCYLTKEVREIFKV